MNRAPLGPAAATWAEFAVGDPRRPVIGRTVLTTLAFAVAATIYLWSGKQIRLLYLHAPWADDPYDTSVSLAVFFIPFIAALSLVRVPLCRRAEPLPAARARDLLRGSRVIVIVVGITLVSEWASVIVGANHDAWTSMTAVLVLALTLMSAATAGAAVMLRHALRLTLDASNANGPDWLADLLSAGTRLSARIGRAGSPLKNLLRGAERDVAPLARAHPIIVAVVIAAAFGVAIAMSQAAAEDGFAWETVLLFATVAGCSMFAFLMSVGSHLRLLGQRRSTQPWARSAAEAAVIGTAVVPLALALRGVLPTVISVTPGALLRTLVLIAIAGATLGFAASTLLRRDAARRRARLG